MAIYHPTIGLEIHIQLNTQSKMFAPDQVAYGDLPNTNLSPTTLAYPGTLPRVNKKPFEYAIKLGLACHSTIAPVNYFARKSYFYPDLPKGYQITQDATPICQGGFVMIHPKEGQPKAINLTRIHLEEDTGKSLHGLVDGAILLDYNRAGTPLLELVTTPAIASPLEAYQFLSAIRKLVRYIDICDGNMEEGSLRCDANVSVKAEEDRQLGNRVEVKNMNSMRSVQLAIEYEINRQTTLLASEETVSSETRNFDALSGKTTPLRRKEQGGEYRYFPEPNIPPVYVSKEWIQEVTHHMPTLPHDLFTKFVQNYQLSAYSASILTENKEMALFYEDICTYTSHYTMAANWIMGPVQAWLNQRSLAWSELPLQPKQVAELTTLVVDGMVGFSTAAALLLPKLMEEASQTLTTKAWAQQLGLIQDQSQDDLQQSINEVLAQYPDKVLLYKQGKKGLLGLFMGEVMEKSGGRANAKLASQLLQQTLASHH